MSQETEPPDPTLQNLIHPNGNLNHPLYYRLHRNATAQPPSPGTPSAGPQATSTLATLDATALRYLLSDLSYTDPYAMDLLVHPDDGGIKHKLYWEYTFRVHQLADQRARERLTVWARAHSSGPAGAESERGVGEEERPTGNAVVGTSGGVASRVKHQSTLPVTGAGSMGGRDQCQLWAGNGRHNDFSQRLWAGAMLPFTNTAVGPSPVVAEDWQRRGEAIDARAGAAPPPYAP